MEWVVNPTTRPLYPLERPGAHCIKAWVGPRDGLDACGKFLHHRDSIPGPSSPSESLYGLSYPGPRDNSVLKIFM